MALKCLLREIGDVCVLDLDGSLSLEERQADGGVVIDQVRGLMAGGKKKFVLNFARLSYMDSAGVGQLIGTITTTRSRGARISVAKPRPEVKKLLELTQLVKAIEVYDDEASALGALAR